MSLSGNDPQLESAAPIALTTLPETLSFAGHELRGPLTVVAGYIRMVLKDRTGALPDHHRRMLEDAEKSCGRLSELLAEMSELARLEKGEGKFNRGAVDVQRLLKEASAEMPPMPNRDIDIAIEVAGVSARVDGDAVRLKAAFTSILLALRRELVASDRIAVRVHRDSTGNVVISIAEADRIDRLLDVSPRELTVFKEDRGLSGLSLAIARRVIQSHAGCISGLRDTKAVAIIAIPSLDT